MIMKTASRRRGVALTPSSQSSSSEKFREKHRVGTGRALAAVTVAHQFLLTVANFLPSAGNCLLMSGDSKMGWRYIQLRWTCAEHCLVTTPSS